MQEEFTRSSTEDGRFGAEQDLSNVGAVVRPAAIAGEAERKRQSDKELLRKRKETKEAYCAEGRARRAESTRDRRVLRILERNYQDRLKDDEAMAAQEATEARRRAVLPTASINQAAASTHDFDQDGIANMYPDVSEDRFVDASPGPHAWSRHRDSSSLSYDDMPSPGTGQELSTSSRSLYPSGLDSLAAPLSPAPLGPALPSTAHIDVSEDAALDPREIMTKPELMALIMERGMTKNREKETKALLARRLRESDRLASIDELHGWLRRRGLITTGNRAELVWRLQEYDARMSKNWRPKHMATLLKSRDAVKARFEEREAEMVAGETMLPRSGRFGVSAGGVPLRAIGSSGQGRALVKDQVRPSVGGEEGQIQQPQRFISGSRPSVDNEDDYGAYEQWYEESE